MLIEFRFKNYRSFRDEAIMSMEAMGLGSKKDYRLAVEYYEKSAENGDSEALLKLSKLYETGGFGLKKNIRKAKEYADAYEQESSSYAEEAAAEASEGTGGRPRRPRGAVERAHETGAGDSARGGDG